MPQARGKEGFTLLEIIVVVAIVAILAGAVAPVIYNEINAARSESTTRELDRIKDGLLALYEDTGRFPTESEGLAALVSDPGLTGWAGPYIADGQGDPLDAVSKDAFGQDYAYDLDPRVTPAGSVDLLVASPGVNRNQDAGRLNRPWDLSTDSDDLFALVSTGLVDREKENASVTEIESIASACREYYYDNAGFPAGLSDLEGSYLDGGYQGENFRDDWNNDYLLQQYGSGPAAPTLLVYSCGPDRQDDSGADDDLSILVSSIPPGRRSTLAELEIAQTALNEQPSLPLTGSWAGAGGIREALGLAATFDLDGWGNSYGVNAGSRVVFSAGPDGNAGQILDNIPTGVGP